jgi:hypothetical protein
MLCGWTIRTNTKRGRAVQKPHHSDANWRRSTTPDAEGDFPGKKSYKGLKAPATPLNKMWCDFRVAYIVTGKLIFPSTYKYIKNLCKVGYCSNELSSVKALHERYVVRHEGTAFFSAYRVYSVNTDNSWCGCVKFITSILYKRDGLRLNICGCYMYEMLLNF